MKSFFFLQPPRKHDNRSAFKRVLNSDRGFGAASRTLETKMVMYIVTAKLNLTFGTIGKATAIKRLQKTAKVVGRNSGNCEEELPKKPVGRLSVNCRPSVDRQVTDSLPTANQQVTDRLRKKKNCGKNKQLT